MTDSLRSSCRFRFAATVGCPLLASFGGCQVASQAGNEQDGRVTGKVALNYAVNDNNLLYGFVARGYKPGGFNSPTSTFGPKR